MSKQSSLTIFYNLYMYIRTIRRCLPQTAAAARFSNDERNLTATLIILLRLRIEYVYLFRII